MALKVNKCGPPCKKLSETEHKFHIEILAGQTKLEAYQRSRPKRIKPVSAAVGASRLLNETNVQDAIHWHREKEAKSVLMSRQELIEVLAAEVRSAKQVEFVEETQSEHTDKDGQVSESVTRKAGARSAVAAAREIAKMQGWHAPQKIDLNMTARELAEEVGADPDIVADLIGDEEGWIRDRRSDGDGS